MKISTEKSAIVYGQYYYDFLRIQKAIIEEMRNHPYFWFSWRNCMELVIDVEFDLGYRHLPPAVEDELILWLLEEFEG